MSSEGTVYFPTAAGVELHDLHPAAKLAIMKYRPVNRERWINEYEWRRVNGFPGNVAVSEGLNYCASIEKEHPLAVLGYLVPLTYNHPPLCKKFPSLCPVVDFQMIVCRRMYNHNDYGLTVDALRWGGHFDKFIIDELFSMFHAHSKMVAHICRMRAREIRHKHVHILLRNRLVLTSRVNSEMTVWTEFGLTNLEALAIVKDTIRRKAREYACMVHFQRAARKAATHNLMLRNLCHPMVFRETFVPAFDAGSIHESPSKKQCY